MIKRNIELAMRLLPVRTNRFYNSQSLSIHNILRAYTKDWHHTDSRYISYDQKHSRMNRAEENVILDHADESNYSKPAYYVMREGMQLTIVIRGTANKADKITDIDTRPMQVDDYWVHTGFYWHACTIF